MEKNGKAKINKYTKLLTIFLAVVEALGIYISYSKMYADYNVFINPGFTTGLLIVLGLVTGTAILMWLGEQITSKGIGNRNIYNNIYRYYFKHAICCCNTI